MSGQVDQRGAAWTFDDFSEGMALGSIDVVVDEHRTSLWRRIYARGESWNEADAVPQSLIVAAMMEAYLKIIQPRPPGNVHAGQKIVMTGNSVMAGARLTFGFSCLGKAMKRERRWMTLGVSGSQDARPVMRGEIVTIWAK